MPKNITSAEDLVKLHEGFRSSLYQCPAGKWTIGYGTNLEDRGLTEEESAYLLRNDLGNNERILSSRSYWSGLDAVRKAVCLDLMYNLGAKGYSGFVKFEKALETGNYPLAAQELRNSRWFTQVKSRGVRLVEMMESGEWPKV